MGLRIAESVEIGEMDGNANEKRGNRLQPHLHRSYIGFYYDQKANGAATVCDCFVSNGIA